MIGQSLGRYRIEEKLGHGGMGEVWRAQDPVLGRSVALKILPAEYSDLPKARPRFLREVKVASALSHPSIARVLDGGEENGCLYLAFELVEGSSVGSLVRHSGILTPGRAAEIARQAAEALAYAHGQGVVHRDVTPENVLVSAGGRVVLIDFGLALPEGSTRFTATGLAMGTASYMAPEVARGERADVRSDVYGLGAVLYEALVGKAPFQGSKPHDVLYDVIHKPAASPRSLCRDVPKKLDRIVMRCLAKKPEDRYQDVQELAGDLREVETQQAPASVPEAKAKTGPAPTGIHREETQPLGLSSPERGGPFRLSRWRDLGVSLILLFAMAGLLRALDPLGWWSLSGRYASLAVLPLANESSDPIRWDHLAHGLGLGLATRLAALPGIGTASWQTSKRFSPGSAPLESIGESLGAELLLVGKFVEMDGRISVSVALVEAATDTRIWGPAEFHQDAARYPDLETEVAVTVSRELQPEIDKEQLERISRAPTEDAAAYEAYLQGIYIFQSGSPGSIDEAVEYAREAIDRDPNLAEAHVLEGAAVLERYYRLLEGDERDLARAEKSFRKAMALRPHATDARRGLIHLFYHQGRVRETLEMAHIPDPASSEALLMRAEALHFGGLSTAASPLFQRVLDLEPANSAAAYYLVMSLAWSGRHETAIAAGNRFLHAFGEDRDIHRVLGDAYLEVGNLEQARHHYEQSHDSLHLGAYLMEVGDAATARQVLEKGLESVSHSLAAVGNNSRVRTRRALHYALLGNRAGFEREADRLLTRNPENEYIRGDIALGYAKLGETEEAERLLRGALQRGVAMDPVFSFRRGFQAMGDLARGEEHRGLREQYEQLLARKRAQL